MTYDNNFYLSAFLENNRVVMNQIYTEVYPRLKNHILRNSGSEDQVWDVYAKGLEVLLLKIRSGELSLTVPLPHFLFGICKMIWLGELRKKKTNLTIFGDQTYISDHDIEQGIIELEQVTLFKEKFKELGKRCQELLEARFQKLSYDKIAESLGYPNAGNARVRYFQCKKQLIYKIKNDPRF